MANRTTQIVECLNKLYDLMPDGIITFEVKETRQVPERMFVSLDIDLGLHHAVLDGIDSVGSVGE